MFIGIDIGLKSLERAATPAAPTLPRRVPNTPEGIAQLRAALTPLTPTLVVLEATGAYHCPLLAALLAAAVPVAVLNPAQVAAFRQSRLGRHKRDRADAQLLARCAEVQHADPRLATPDEPDVAPVRTLVGYRDDLVVQRTAARNRRHAAQWPAATAVVTWLEADPAALAARLREVAAAIAALLATRPETAVLTAQVGVGLVTAAALLAYLPAAVLGNPKAAARTPGSIPATSSPASATAAAAANRAVPPCVAIAMWRP